MKSLKNYILEASENKLLPKFNKESIKTFLNSLLKDNKLDKAQLAIVKKMVSQINGKSMEIDFDSYPRGYEDDEPAVVATVCNMVGVITGKHDGLICVNINDYYGRYCIFNSDATILIAKDNYYIIDKCIFNALCDIETSRNRFSAYFEEDEEEAMYYGLRKVIEIKDKTFKDLSDEEQNIVIPLYNDYEYETILVCNYDDDIDYMIS